MRILLICFLLLSCETNNLISSNDKIDVDLTLLSSTMVYAEVFNMIMNPENYAGKIVKMKGQFALFEDIGNGKPFYACVIPDTTACCLQGFEFIPLSEYNYPKDLTLDLLDKLNLYNNLNILQLKNNNLHRYPIY